MSPAEQNFNSAQAKADQSIETIYTTVESHRDQTDWLTVVSNLRQINRQLVEEIARLEEALASAKQTLHTQKEANQNHEITILQQQDELSIADDRVGALFQQLETSHQIGQRQQTLIETLSQQLEIVRSIVPQIETEHEELQQKYQLQSQKLVKTEQVAIELHRRLKLQSTGVTPATIPTAAITTTTATTPAPVENELNPASAATLPTEIIPNISTSTAATPATEIELDLDSATPDQSLLATGSADSNISTAEIDPAPPAAPNNWREVIFHGSGSPIATPDPAAADMTAAATVNQQSSTAIEELTTPKSDPNWPAPTVNRARSIAHTVKIDLPKFPKKQEN
jgi:hypothetical protein